MAGTLTAEQTRSLYNQRHQEDPALAAMRAQIEASQQALQASVPSQPSAARSEQEFAHQRMVNEYNRMIGGGGSGASAGGPSTSGGDSGGGSGVSTGGGGGGPRPGAASMDALKAVMGGSEGGGGGGGVSISPVGAMSPSNTRTGIGRRMPPSLAALLKIGAY